MKLNTREWGAGDRIAVLVHGIMSDSRTWHRVGPALAERGYRVIAVDLRGHGSSGRTDDYPTEAYGADLIETLEVLGDMDVAIGHSLGGLAVQDAIAAGLRVSRAVYVDPAWRIPRRENGFSPDGMIELAEYASRGLIASIAPRWDAEDIEIELETLDAWDQQTVREFAKWAEAALATGTVGDGTGLPLRAAVPSLVMLAEDSRMIDSQDAETLRGRGFELRTVPGAGHSIHRDDLAGFMKALEGWI